MGSLACVSGLLVPSSAEPVVGLASPFVRWPWFGLPAPWFCVSLVRLLVVFLARFFVCLVRPGVVLVSVSLASFFLVLSRALTSLSCPPYPACLSFRSRPAPRFSSSFFLSSRRFFRWFFRLSRSFFFSLPFAVSRSSFLVLSRALNASLLPLLGLAFFSLSF